MTARPAGDDASAVRARLARQGEARRPVVALQGERGAYGHLAVQRLWGEATWVLPCWTIDDVMAAVRAGRASHAVVPVHNVIVGDLPEVVEAVARASLDIVGEVWQPVRHCLLAPPAAEPGRLRRVYSHPVALAQCGRFLAGHPALERTRAYDTAGAARDVAARGRPDEAAIADAGCAARYGLQVLAHDVGDRPDNATRFAVVRSRA